MSLLYSTLMLAKRRKRKKADVIRKRQTINLTLRWEYKKVCLKKLGV